MTQGELFPLPGGPKQPRRVTERKGVLYTPFKPRTRKHCSDCTDLIHKYGQGGAPLPKAVRWKRTTKDDMRLLCNDHKRERQESEQ